MDSQLRSRPNPLTLAFPFFLAANGWWIHGWIGGIAAAGWYLVMLFVINTVVWHWWLPENDDLIVRRFQAIKWALFITCLIGTSLAGASIHILRPV